MAKILLVDDDPHFSKFFRRAVVGKGHSVEIVASLSEVGPVLSAFEPELIFLDVNLPDGSGLSLLPGIKELETPPEVIVVTGYPNDEGAKRAISEGAWDYVCKIDPFERILLAADRALLYRKEKLAAITQGGLRVSGVVGSSPHFRKSLAQAARAANSEAPVLVTGETGTGKELFARAIHENSKRAKGPFVIVDCASLPLQLVESILFGHKKGAFTGALNDYDGLIAMADGGTLFLDEVGELDGETQKRFLRVLQEKIYRPVGSSKEVSSNFRVVAATNKDLPAEVERGAFRSDLYHRLSSLSISLPPLRERAGDIPMLARKFVGSEALPDGMIKGISLDFLEAVENYDWPGNVRELKQAILAAVSNAEGFSTVYAMHLPLNIRVKSGFDKAGQESAPAAPAFSASMLSATLEAVREASLASAEFDYLSKLTRDCHGDVAKACEVSGLSRSRLYALLKKHSLSLT